MYCKIFTENPDPDPRQNLRMMDPGPFPYIMYTDPQH